MPSWRRIALGFTLFCGFSAPDPSSARQPEFHLLPDFAGGATLVLPYGISADGSTVVGNSHSSLGVEAFVWTRQTGMTRMPSSELGIPNTAWDASADGSVIVGAMSTDDGLRAFRWSKADGYQLIGTELAGPNSNANAYSVSDDGAVIAGDVVSSTGLYEGFVWTASGTQLLGDLPGGGVHAEVRAISADGSTIVGTSESLQGKEAFRWTRDDGMQGLGELPGNGFGSNGAAVSANGEVIAASSLAQGFTQVQAARWTAASGMVGIGEHLGMSNYWSEAKGITADGSLIVGQDLTNGAFVWSEPLGFRPLKEVLVDRFGLADEIGARSLVSAQAVSADGRVITGFSSGIQSGWVAFVPEPHAGILALIAAACASSGILARRLIRRSEEAFQ